MSDRAVTRGKGQMGRSKTKRPTSVELQHSKKEIDMLKHRRKARQGDAAQAWMVASNENKGKGLAATNKAATAKKKEAARAIKLLDAEIKRREANNTRRNK